MIPAPHNSAGRPRTSSRSVLEDAAAELFLENTYQATTIDQIAQRAGVSRNTFFNYFGAKSDLLWVEVDAGIDRLAEELETVPPGETALPALCAAVLRVTGEFGVDRVPLALTQGELMGIGEEIRASGLLRLSRRAEVIAAFLSRQARLDRRSLAVLAAANAISGAITAAWEVWALDGIGRAPLSRYAGEAFDLVAMGIKRSLG
ncbi:MAG TPA: TetR/AcrR family transcriptional regulator [Lacisediminihabitans sp.]|uniref:TetR/AcrR family transcriptional regulator n=1 Tax=Lacisediminihabitans sp. TaxID=2787631 RepID=UPI002ED864DD